MAQRAHADAYAEGFAAGGCALEAELEAERRAFAARLASERALWAEDEGARLGAMLGAALASIEIQIAESVAGILRPFIGATLRDKAIDALDEAIGVLLRTDQPMIEISGAPDLLAALERRLVGVTAAIAWSPNCAADVRIVADETIIKSRIEAWMRWIETPAEANR